MTEDEAKTKWCPFVQFHMSHDGDTATNRDRFVLPETDLTRQLCDAVRHNARCVGSECMAWRWEEQQPVEDGVGFCGLAGKP